MTSPTDQAPLLETGADAASNVRLRLESVERWLTHPASPRDLDAAVAELEQACRQWPALMACVTDRAAWDSLARQLRRLETLADTGQQTAEALAAVNGASRGYTDRGEPAALSGHPAQLDCRG